jgi:hypothetical protein
MSLKSPNLLWELERRAFQSDVLTICLETARRRPLTLEFYRKHGYQETGQSSYGAVETVQFKKVLDERICRDAANQTRFRPGRGRRSVACSTPSSRPA